MGKAQHPALQMAPMGRVVPHERHDPARVAGLMARLTADGRLVNPPIAAAAGDRYVVLDGATRLAALRQLGYPHIVLQVVDPTQQGVQLYTWQHVIRGLAVDALLALVREAPGIRLQPASPQDLYTQPLGENEVGFLLTRDGRGFRLAAAQASGMQEAEAAVPEGLNHVVAAYMQQGRVERTLDADVEQLIVHFPDLAGVMHFPPFTLPGVLALAVAGQTVPAGITRFVIPGRVLRLNAPLDKLAGAESISAKQTWLDEFLHAKFAGRQVRYYAEPVVLMDE